MTNRMNIRFILLALAMYGCGSAPSNEQENLQPTNELALTSGACSGIEVLRRDFNNKWWHAYVVHPYPDKVEFITENFQTNAVQGKYGDWYHHGLIEDGSQISLVAHYGESSFQTKEFVVRVEDKIEMDCEQMKDVDKEVGEEFVCPNIEHGKNGNDYWREFVIDPDPIESYMVLGGESHKLDFQTYGKWTYGNNHKIDQGTEVQLELVYEEGSVSTKKFSLNLGPIEAHCLTPNKEQEDDKKTPEEQNPNSKLIFLLVGQSNMHGSSGYDDIDRVPHPRVKMLGFQDHDNHSYNEWSPALSPMHYPSWRDSGVGPGDTFARLLADTLTDKEIYLVPAALSGSPIENYLEGVVTDHRRSLWIPPDNRWVNGYDFLLSRARWAVESSGGQIAGVLFHQGESNNGQDAWSDKVSQFAKNLRADLELSDQVPFLMGELVRGTWYDQFNRNELPEAKVGIPSSYIISSQGLTHNGDRVHFSKASYRELGRRYAHKMIDLISPKDETKEEKKETSQAKTIVEAHGQLSFQGTKLKDSCGRDVQLQGMSFFWHQWDNSAAYWNEDTVRWLRDDWKVDILRGALAVSHGGLLSDKEHAENTMRELIEAAIKLGVYVLIDWHVHDPYTKEAIEFFAKMAKDYGSYPNVIYEVFNEPDGSSWTDLEEDWPTIKRHAMQVIAAIRDHDTDNPIIVGTPFYAQFVDHAADDPIEIDSQGRAVSNIAYTLHFYAGNGSHMDPLMKRADYALNKGIPLFVTESGRVGTNYGPNNSINPEGWNRWENWMNVNKVSWIKWSLSIKNEISSSLKPSASITGEWDYDRDLTEEGKWNRSKFRAINSIPEKCIP